MTKSLGIKMGGAAATETVTKNVYYYTKAMGPSYSASGTTALNNARGSGQVSLGTSGTCYFTFTEPQDIIGFMWTDGSDTPNRYLRSLTVQYSDNNSTWTTQLSTSTSSHGSYSRTAASQGAHKYWRVSWSSSANPKVHWADFIARVKVVPE